MCYRYHLGLFDNRLHPIFMLHEFHQKFWQFPDISWLFDGINWGVLPVFCRKKTKQTHRSKARADGDVLLQARWHASAGHLTRDDWAFDFDGANLNFKSHLNIYIYIIVYIYILYCIILYCIILCCIILYYIVLYYIILYHIILYHIILFYFIYYRIF